MTGASTAAGWPHRPVAPADPWATPEAAPPAMPPPAWTPPPPPQAPPMSRGPLVALIVGITLAVLLVAGAVGDVLWRNSELDTLLDRIEVAESAQITPNAGLANALQGCGLSDPDECDLVAAARIARSGLPGLNIAVRGVEDFKVSRFHDAIATLQARYLDHAHAWQRFLAAVAADPESGIDGDYQIRTTFRAAGEAAYEALPPFVRHGNRARVDRIFRGYRR